MTTYSPFLIVRDFIDNAFPSLARTFRLLRDRIVTKNWQEKETEFGFSMVGPLDMLGSRTQSGEFKLFLELSAKSDVFIDVGANCGLFALAAASRGLNTLAVEPNSDNLRILLRNIRANACSDLEVFPIALGREPDVLPLFGGGEGASLVENWGGIKNTYCKYVPINTLDNILGQRFSNERILIKIDVEGHELAVLQGAISTLDRHPSPNWLVENGFKENFSGDTNPNFCMIFDAFWRHGYQCVTADDQRRNVTSEDVDRWIENQQRDFGFLNYFFFKDESHRERPR